jgi:hypothetical protein
MTTFRITRLAATAMLALVLLPACDGVAADANPEPDLNSAPNPNCAKEMRKLIVEKFDINSDGTPDWFYVVRCSEDDRGDQLEVLDGRGDPKHPTRFGTSASIHPTRGLQVQPGGCLMFRKGQVFVADKRTAGSRGWRVRMIGTWKNNELAIVTAPSGRTLPCDHPGAAERG